METNLNLETAIQDDKVMQDFDLESLLMGADHSLWVKAAPIESDYGSKGCVNLPSSIAVSRFNALFRVWPVPYAKSTEGRADLLHLPLLRSALFAYGEL